MASNFVEWAADRIYESIKKGSCRESLLKDLRDHHESVIAIITEDIHQLSMRYIMEKGEVVGLETDNGDPHCFSTCAKHIVEYMRDEMLKEEIAKIP